MRSGKLRHRITIQNKVDTQDPNTGEVLKTWGTFKRPWASVEPLSAKEYIAGKANQSEVSARITMRYVEGLTPDMRILHRGEVYVIQGVLPDVKSGKEYITIPVAKGVMSE